MMHSTSAMLCSLYVPIIIDNSKDVGMKVPSLHSLFDTVIGGFRKAGNKMWSNVV